MNPEETFNQLIDRAENAIDEVESNQDESFENEMIDAGAKLQRLGKKLMEKSAPEDHPAIQAAIDEACEIVTALIETVGVLYSMTTDVRTLLDGIKGEWDRLQELKRSSGT